MAEIGGDEVLYTSFDNVVDQDDATNYPVDQDDHSLKVIPKSLSCLQIKTESRCFDNADAKFDPAETV